MLRGFSWPGRNGSEAGDPFARRRLAMVEKQIAARGVRDVRVLKAMRQVPRHRFVGGELADEAYEDHPLPIGNGQTISQPYIVAYMIEALGLPAGTRVLEIGTGCGYQAAVLAAAGFEVFTVEIVARLAEEATAALKELGYDGIHVRNGDGWRGWPEEAPFHGIIVAAAPDEVPEALCAQLASDGRMVIPIGSEEQRLWRYSNTPTGLRREGLIPVRFVPMTGGG